MIAWLLSKVFAGVLRVASGGILSRVLDMIGAGQDAKTQITMAEINMELETRRNARDIRVATSGFWEMRLCTFLIVFPFIGHLWLVALDTMFRFGWAIPAFPKPFDEWQGAILMSFFGVFVGVRAISTVAGIFSRWFK